MTRLIINNIIESSYPSLYFNIGMTRIRIQSSGLGIDPEPGQEHGFLMFAYEKVFGIESDFIQKFGFIIYKTKYII